MKQRIINTLAALAKEKVPSEFEGMQELLIAETSMDVRQIRDRSQNILKHLLHHYAQFSIETIDSFNHRLIRTFAHDLKLASNFEVSLDTDEILSKAVDQFIERAGTDDTISELLLEFALRKTDEDKSWDISFDLKKTAALLGKENDLFHLQQLRELSITDFMKLQGVVTEKGKRLQEEITQLAKSVLDQLQENNIPLEVFQRGTFPNHFKKLEAGEYDVYKNKLEEYLEVGGTKLYKAQTPEGIQQTIDLLTADFLETYSSCKDKVHQLKLYKNIVKNLVPLAALNGVYQELERIKEEENILPINEFNSLIFSEIKDQPAPFIYERLGDRYRHFFIDEFQDTSQLQWENLIPLVDNALSQATINGETGSLLLVGDGKQSIYRWRGGLPEQFMELSKEKNPFTVSQKELLVLETNYRSAKEIIEFNNSFFQFTAQHFSDPGHQEMYKEGSSQNFNKKEGGYVALEFIEARGKEEEHELYPEKVLKTIHQLVERGFAYKDICILTRRKKDGIIISEYLMEKDSSIALVSDETLLLRNSDIVDFLVHLLQLSVDPLNDDARIHFLEFLYGHFRISGPRHEFYAENLTHSITDLAHAFERYDVTFSFETVHQLPIYECLEYSIGSLKLEPKMNVFAAAFMDLVFRFSQRPGKGKVDFLEYWESEKEKASIPSSSKANAVRLMTIHKSKGLEFPVVIFPYADVNLYSEIEPKTWFPWGQNGFDHLLIDYKKELEATGTMGAEMVQARRATLELDNMNLLYVALTRPKQELYVFAKKEPIKDSLNSFNTFLIAYLISLGLWEHEKNLYTFGTIGNPGVQEDTSDYQTLEIPYTSSTPEARNLSIVTSSVFETEAQETAIGLGNLFHDTMARIHTMDDVQNVLADFESIPDDEKLYSELKDRITQLVNHPELSTFFESPHKVYNEREIATPKKMVRPDRIVVHKDNSATIIDYKTGKHNPKYVEQIYEYADALQSMGYVVREKLLVYSNTDGIMINKA